MNFPDMIGTSVGTVRVETSNYGGHPPEFFAERLVDRLIHVSTEAPPEIRHQALAYQEAMRSISLAMINRAILSDRTTIIYQLRKAGMEDAANLVWKMGT